MVTRPINASRFPCFDGLRALAALSVVAVHTTFVSGFTGRSGIGNYTSRLEIGVSVFFVISGFLLYRPFAVAHFEGRDVSIPRFWTRRLKRIIPAYWAAFIVVTYVMHADKIRHGWAAVPVYLGFAQIYSPYYALSGITQAWSLCTEMTFYLALPLWAWCIGRRRRSPDSQLRLELLGLGGWVAVSFVYRSIVLTAHGQLALTMPNWLPGYTDLFALGMLLAVFTAWTASTGRSPRSLDHPSVPWISWAIAGGLFVWVSNIGLPVKPVTASPLGLSLARQTLYALFAFFLVAPAVVGPQDEGLVRRLLQTRPLVFLGTVSYGIYLWHEAWIDRFLHWSGDRLFTMSFLELLAFVVATATAAASVSYFAIERPMLRGSIRIPRLPRRPRAIPVSAVNTEPDTAASNVATVGAAT
ncbi:MAG TPA: acyltransferase [Acidimicrobiales bacterium]